MKSTKPYSSVIPRPATKEEPYYVIPIPPKSVVRLAACDRATSGWQTDVGRIFRIGYYGEQDGLDCIWLVNDQGEYEQTVDHKLLFEHFDIIVLSDEDDLHGDRRPQLPNIRKANKLRTMSSRAGSRKRTTGAKRERKRSS